MINCAHPTHFAATLDQDADWVLRVRGIRANASRCSHAELDAMTEVDAGDPLDLALRYRALRARPPQIHVLGGCCGTDHRPVEALARACVSVATSTAASRLECSAYATASSRGRVCHYVWIMWAT